MAEALICQTCKGALPAGVAVCPKCGPLVKCDDCGALVQRGTTRCPGCDRLIDYNAPLASGTTKTWEDWATRTTAVLAVLAALSSGRWGASNLKAILEQGRVNDEWSYYQAKSIKQHTAEEFSGLARAIGGAAPSPEVAKFIADADAEAKREKADKEGVKRDAEEYVKFRDDYVDGSFWFEIAFACLQVGVILCTIASAARKRALWVISIFVGVIGLSVVANGFLRFIPAPPASKKLAPPEGKMPAKSPAPGSSPAASPAESAGGH